MGKDFNPAEYNYEVVHESKEDGVFHFQNKIRKLKLQFTDLIELSFWSKQNIWLIFVSSQNLKPYLRPDEYVDEDRKIPLFIGEIKNDFDYQFLMKRIIINPQKLMQIGC